MHGVMFDTKKRQIKRHAARKLCNHRSTELTQIETQLNPKCFYIPIIKIYWTQDRTAPKSNLSLIKIPKPT